MDIGPELAEGVAAYSGDHAGGVAVLGGATFAGPERSALLEPLMDIGLSLVEGITADSGD